MDTVSFSKSRRIFFQLYNWFQLFSFEKENSEVAGYLSEQVNIAILKGDVDDFSYFSLIFSYFTF
jgi:hypothetical protein